MRNVLEKARISLGQIPWTQIFATKRKKINLDIILAVPAIVISAIFIYYAVESLPSFIFFSWLENRL